MENLLKVAAIALTAAIGAVVIKKQIPEIGLVLGLFAGASILLLSLDAIESVKTAIERLADTAALAPAIVTPVVKTIGIALVTKITAEICKDAKEGGLAVFTEIAGAATAILVCLPLLETALKMITDLL